MRILVTGSAGLIGSEVCLAFASDGWNVTGVDNNMRQFFFGPDGDTTWNLKRIQEEVGGAYQHSEIDIRNRKAVLDLLERVKPDLIVHAAAQPSHDRAAAIPFDDFETNAVGTLNLLEATRRFCFSSPFVFLSTNKVYGDRPNEKPLVERETRWDYAEKSDYDGVDENCSIDQSTHSLFGASKVAADILVQEYGRYFKMMTCCLRGGCLTGPNHSGVKLHGFLSYLVKCNLTSDLYTIYGYKGKQVRDNIHSHDVVNFIKLFSKSPKSGVVYNIGGGRINSISIIEAIRMVEIITGKKMRYNYCDQNRVGDHICYISNLKKIRSDFPEWNITKSNKDIVSEIVSKWTDRLK